MSILLSEYVIDNILGWVLVWEWLNDDSSREMVLDNYNILNLFEVLKGLMKSMTIDFHSHQGIGVVLVGPVGVVVGYLFC